MKFLFPFYQFQEPPEPTSAAIASGTVPPINTELTFAIHEQDKALVRDNIVQATVQAPEVLRIQLAVCVSIIIKNDFPHKWPQVVDQVSIYLQDQSTPQNWLGMLLFIRNKEIVNKQL